jgi:hypothetical protein
MSSLLSTKDRDRGRKVAHLRASNERYTDALQSVPKSEWPACALSNVIGAFRSSKFLVQVYAEASNVIRLSINRADLDAVGGWRDGISWDELQEIKNQCGYADREAIEIYPRAQDVVNVANIRHLWLLPTDLPCGWRKKV